MKVNVKLNALLILAIITAIFGGVEKYVFDKQFGNTIMLAGIIWVYIVIKVFIRHKREAKKNDFPNSNSN